MKTSMLNAILSRLFVLNEHVVPVGQHQMPYGMYYPVINATTEEPKEAPVPTPVDYFADNNVKMAIVGAVGLVFGVLLGLVAGKR